MKLKEKVSCMCFELRHSIMSSNILAVSSLAVIPLPFEAATLEPVTAVNCCSVLNCPMPVKHFFFDDVTFIQSCSNRPLTIEVDFLFSFFFFHFSHCCVGLEVKEDPEEFHNKFLPSAIDNLLFLGRRLQARLIRTIKVFKCHS